jgi:hypothetical protein
MQRRPGYLREKRGNLFNFMVFVWGNLCCVGRNIQEVGAAFANVAENSGDDIYQ